MGKRLLNSLIAIGAGWLTGVAIFVMMALPNSFHGGPDDGTMSLSNSGALWIVIFGLAMGMVLLLHQRLMLKSGPLDIGAPKR